jgi:hypothetical protein
VCHCVWFGNAHQLLCRVFIEAIGVRNQRHYWSVNVCHGERFVVQHIKHLLHKPISSVFLLPLSEHYLSTQEGFREHNCVHIDPARRCNAVRSGGEQFAAKHSLEPSHVLNVNACNVMRLFPKALNTLKKFRNILCKVLNGLRLLRQRPGNLIRRCVRFKHVLVEPSK